MFFQIKILKIVPFWKYSVPQLWDTEHRQLQNTVINIIGLFEVIKLFYGICWRFIYEFII